MEEIIEKIRARYEEAQWEKYQSRLLTRKIRLSEVPESFRHNPRYGCVIYITAFRADRMVSKTRYEEDLEYFELELLLMEAGGKNLELLKHLQTVLEDMKKNLALFDVYKISDFC